jgi:PAS domain S-box-containing protein
MMDDIASDTFLARVVREGPDAVVFADSDGRIRLWNAAASRLFGFTAAEALGASLDLILPEAQRPRHWAGYHRVMQGGQSRYGAGDTLAVPALHKDGHRLSIEFTILPMRGADGEMLGIAAFLRDVTPRFEELRALRRELAALKAGG